MRLTGTSAVGIRLPIISPKDDLVSIVAEHVSQFLNNEGIKLTENDIVAVTEAIVAKAENNYCKTADIADDIRAKFGDTEIGLVYPILSRNRFLNILKGVAKGAKKVHILLNYPHDEVGNPIMDIDLLDEVQDKLKGRMVMASEFQAVAGKYKHNFTGMDYVEIYESVGRNVNVYFSNDPRDILKLTKNVLVAEIHSRHRTRTRLLKAGAEKVLTLSDILSTSVNGSGFNSQYGLLGSNLSTEDTLKLFPDRAQEFANAVQARLKEKTGVTPEVMVYGDLRGDEKRDAVTKMIKAKNASPDAYREGTTPRIYADLVGSLCDLMGGSGDKGTPVIIIRGYFDDYATE